MRGGSPLEGGGALSHPATATAPGLAQGSVLRVLGDRADGLPLPNLSWPGRLTSSGAGTPSPRYNGELRNCILGQSGTLKFPEGGARWKGN